MVSTSVRRCTIRLSRLTVFFFARNYREDQVTVSCSDYRGKCILKESARGAYIALSKKDTRRGKYIGSILLLVFDDDLSPDGNNTTLSLCMCCPELITRRSSGLSQPSRSYVKYPQNFQISWIIGWIPPLIKVSCSTVSLCV